MNTEETVRKLQKQLGIKDRRIYSLQREVDFQKARAIAAEKALAPTKRSLEKLTAEKSKWLRKHRSNT